MSTETADKYKLTQYSHGAGCGCKISPKILSSILHTDVKQPKHQNLLVGNDTRDDAAVFDIGGGKAIISTTDFFMPIVDDAADFGRVASANAISDIYAMGGRPLMAIAILGWPIDKVPTELAQRVLEGAREICSEAGIPLAGGHSIDNQEPLFGLAVTGEVYKEHLKKNSTGKTGCLIYLTKPLGVGILSTAQKKGILKEEHASIARDQMVKLNSIGALLGQLPYVSSMTDVTGFGLLGHLGEICESSNISAEIDFEQVPVIPEALEYLEQKSIPGGTVRNWDSYRDTIGDISDWQRNLLCDPQTSGGLLVLVEEDKREEFEAVMLEERQEVKPFGRTTERQEKLVYIR